MVEVFFTWGVILCISLILGYAVINVLFRKTCKALLKVDCYIVCGLLCCTLYAQFFSLFYKVGIKACFVLLIIGIIVTVLIIKNRLLDFSICKLFGSIENNTIFKIVLGICIVFGMASITSTQATFYDSGLYHAQAIRWLEEYGIVKGLGNFHNRFAYNSAFLPLQALFSFKWHFGRSLHTVNGFFCCFAVLYAILSSNVVQKKQIRLSDLFKLAGIVYVFDQRSAISSPNTDMMALLMAWYIITKWQVFIENDIKEPAGYIFLSILSVFTVTLKLSCAMLVFLSIYPLIMLCRKREYKTILSSVILCITVVIPWLIRNVIISGYLLYPYEQIDVFSVDWKMPASVLQYDRREIMVWGRNLKDVSKYDYSLCQWMPGWFGSQNLLHKMIFIAAIAALIYCLYIIIRNVIKRIECAETCVIIIMVLCTCMWLFSAPLMRYGEMYLFILIAILISSIRNKSVVQFIFFFIAVTVTSQIVVSAMSNTEYRIQQGDYESYTNQEKELDGIRVFEPADGADQSGYYDFPAVPYDQMLRSIEPRGNKIESGFRMKADCKNKHINEYGNEW